MGSTDRVRSRAAAAHDAPVHTPDPSRAHRPLLDHLVSVAVGKALAWLGRRAIDRGDRHDFDHCVAALRAGDCTDVCTQARTDRTSR